MFPRGAGAAVFLHDRPAGRSILERPMMNTFVTSASRKSSPTASATNSLSTGEQPWHEAFLKLVPTIRKHAIIRFRRLSPVDREEAVQEVVASSLLSFLRLIENKKEHLIFAGRLAHYAVLQFRDGRRVGNRLNCKDITSAYCQRRKKVRLESLDKCEPNRGVWHEVLVEDRHSTPAEIAAARLDISAWFNTLAKGTRRIAERLATGESTFGAARAFGVSPSRISQLRGELHRGWTLFQGETSLASK
jgi:hypothetical protein